MNDARRRFWKEKFEQAWRAGDKEGMKAAEEMLEAYAAYEEMMIQDRMVREKQRGLA